jgi:ABC-type sugar transport system ATPase subunit
MSLRLERVTVARDDRVLLAGVDLEVGDTERVVVLGSSGAGKSTLLRTVAGLEDTVAGRVLIDDRDVGALPPASRDVAMIFPRATLQPHLTVRGNLALPLRLRRRPRGEVRDRVRAEARTMAIEDLLGRRPGTLAGGERHAVALAHALVRRTRLLLADEPFSGLDAAQRAGAMHELRTVLDGYGTSLVLATNDPSVATALGHRVAVLERGVVLQVDEPTSLRSRPATRQVAELIDPWPLVVLSGRVEGREGRVWIAAPPLAVPCPAPALTGMEGATVLVTAFADAVRPTGPGDPRPGTFDARVEAAVFLGARVQVTLRGARGPRLTALVAPPGPARGARGRWRIDPRRLTVFAASGRALVHGV